MRVKFQSVSRQLCLVVLPLLLVGAGEDEGDLLPDLIVDGAALRDVRIDRSTLPGRRLLRLTTSTPNIGAGALEVRGSTIVAPDAQEVLQRIYRADGSHWDRVAGTFAYHPTHRHTHFDDWAVYRLRERSSGNTVGEILAQGDKTSFCLLDVIAHAAADGGASQSAPPHYTTCGQMVQGISPGWSDVYDRELDDQWIDITDIPDGAYWLEAEVDPEGQVLEEPDGEANNITRVAIELSGDTVAFSDVMPEPPPDHPGPGMEGDPDSNQPPELSVLQPSEPTWVEQAYEGLTVQWSASDPDDDPVTISLWVDRDGKPGPESLPLGGYQKLPNEPGYAVINTAALDIGTWYLLVEASDGGKIATSRWAPGSIAIYHKGDLDADGEVDRADWVQLVQRRRAQRDEPLSALVSGWEPQLDFDRDGDVDETDIDLFRSAALAASAHHD